MAYPADPTPSRWFSLAPGQILWMTAVGDPLGLTPRQHIRILGWLSVPSLAPCV
jgi:hypothetical protein